jgi:hypothetical protein
MPRPWGECWHVKLIDDALDIRKMVGTIERLVAEIGSWAVDLHEMKRCPGFELRKDV